MNNAKRIWRAIVFLGIIFVGITPRARGQERDSTVGLSSRKFVHGVKAEVRPEYIFQTHSFLEGDNPEGKLIRGAFSYHLKYFLRYRPGSVSARAYGDVYQGIGFGYYTFGEPRLLGDPLAFYLFQGARVARFSPRVSFHYEWNLGLSAGWKTFNTYDNPYNKIIGSKVNAYINANFYLRWQLSPGVSLTSGITVSHFSNGNTAIPNAGLNTIGGDFGVECNFHGKDDLKPLQANDVSPCRPFRRHVSYDFVFFGSWHSQGIKIADGLSPSPESYPVFGLNFTPMYNAGYKLRFGMSLDGTYDGGANLYTEYDVYGQIDKSQIVRPPLGEQLALGISGRVEYVMPFFTVGIGLGTNFIGKGDLSMFYQMLTLKIAMSQTSFLHVGYNLRDFHDPNFLMLGVGFRLNSKSFAF